MTRPARHTALLGRAQNAGARVLRPFPGLTVKYAGCCRSWAEAIGAPGTHNVSGALSVPLSAGCSRGLARAPCL